MKLYDNSRTVANEQDILMAFQQRSLLSYQQHSCIQNIAYAATARSCLDLFPLAQARKTVVFVHGGYWQWCNKSDFAFIATDVVANNMQCVLLEYDLAPQRSMGEIVQQIQKALDFIQQQAWSTQEIMLVGHSAGAHLSALMLKHPAVSEAVLLSGIYDLAPIQQTHLNTALNLSEHEIRQYSPLLIEATVQKPYAIFCGAQELDELIGQSQSYFHRRKAIDPDFVSFQLMDNTHHYNILDEYFHRRLTTHT
ncbi:hypothetical protein F993_03631 [Acinetobacter proteolyticus]|uniref:BD-FAE-like domain-containing protein n=1 Tax=Acinetobacter proteolyticus TaxID=1776741 RepID=A0ABN0J9B3_9GAMM|nr:alpha/beta hydrolase [Acinetobacter proteolyticus]ENU21710.1 hypothetical protein F993_03631 [Acinetobacter proteolyticus]QHH93772.1 alpha/beta hydrolase [Acinetobacter gyllenbergii]